MQSTPSTTWRKLCWVWSELYHVTNRLVTWGTTSGTMIDWYQETILRLLSSGFRQKLWQGGYPVCQEVEVPQTKHTNAALTELVQPKGNSFPFQEQPVLCICWVEIFWIQNVAGCLSLIDYHGLSLEKQSIEISAKVPKPKPQKIKYHQYKVYQKFTGGLDNNAPENS